jgi:hypothetical protein
MMLEVRMETDASNPGYEKHGAGATPQKNLNQRIGA